MVSKCRHIIGLLMLGGVALVTSCVNDDDPVGGAEPIPYEEQLAIDVEIIDEYLAENEIDAEVDDASGLRYVIHEEGTGASPTINDNVVVAYEGRLLRDGGVFDSNDELNFPLNRLIRGWQIGLPKIKAGGSITLYIPSGLGYGPGGAGVDIPPNANLIFDIDLLDVQ